VRAEGDQVVLVVVSAFAVCVPSLSSDCLSWLDGGSVVAFDAELVDETSAKSAAKSLMDVVVADAGDAVNKVTGYPEVEGVGIVVERVDMGTLAAEAEQLVGRRCCAHVDRGYLVSLQKQVSWTEEYGTKLEDMDETFEWLPSLPGFLQRNMFLTRLACCMGLDARSIAEYPVDVVG